MEGAPMVGVSPYPTKNLCTVSSEFFFQFHSSICPQGHPAVFRGTTSKTTGLFCHRSNQLPQHPAYLSLYIFQPRLSEYEFGQGLEGSLPICQL